MPRTPKKPGYTLTRLAFWISFVNAWAIIQANTVAALWFNAPQAIGFAGIVVPSMVLMIAGILGIHRAFGNMDLRVATEAAAATPDPEADPAKKPKGELE